MKILHSLRWRIQLWHGILLLLVLVGLGIAAFRFEKNKGEQRIDDELRMRAAVLLDLLPRREDGRPPPRGDRPPPPEFENGNPSIPDFSNKIGDGFYYTIWRRNGEVWGQSAILPDRVPQPKRPQPGELESTNRTRNDFREIYLFTPPGDCLLVGTSTSIAKAELKTFMQRLIAIEAVIFILGFGGGWWATSRALRPLSKITATSQSIAEGNLDRRIDLPPSDSELGQLATQLNSTFEKLEASFLRQAQFTSDAAHELRTPLSIVIAQAQLALKSQRPASEYREMFETSLRAARRMQKLTQSLLELAKLDHLSNDLERVPCDLAALANEAASILELPASERNVTFEKSLSPARCSADPDAILRVILNLLSNALEHGRTDSIIGLMTREINGSVQLIVTDQGPGISPQHLPHLFDRFYRSDQSRNRKTGGTGLGLAICKAIAEAHGGSVTVTSEVGKGSRFTLELPLK